MLSLACSQACSLLPAYNPFRLRAFPKVDDFNDRLANAILRSFASKVTEFVGNQGRDREQHHGTDDAHWVAPSVLGESETL